jgi:hypothetical protein
MGILRVVHHVVVGGQLANPLPQLLIPGAHATQSPSSPPATTIPQCLWEEALGRLQMQKCLLFN